MEINRKITSGVQSQKWVNVAEGGECSRGEFDSRSRDEVALPTTSNQCQAVAIPGSDANSQDAWTMLVCW